jgi:hypothetical protein
VTDGSAHTQRTATHFSNESPDTTLGKLPLIWLWLKYRDLSCANTQEQHTLRTLMTVPPVGRHPTRSHTSHTATQQRP